jgi:hypothetical protein
LMFVKASFSFLYTIAGIFALQPVSRWFEAD